MREDKTTIIDEKLVITMLDCPEKIVVKDLRRGDIYLNGFGDLCIYSPNLYKDDNGKCQCQLDNEHDCIVFGIWREGCRKERGYPQCESEEGYGNNSLIRIGLIKTVDKLEG